jgi:hypothetical protein
MRPGPWAPAVIWGIAFFVSQSLLVGWRRASLYVAAAAVLCAVLIPAAILIRKRRDKKRRRQNPFWVE